EERRPQQQVLGRVAGDRELGEEHEVGPRVPRLREQLEDAVAVAVEVADDAVHLCEREPHSSSRGGLSSRSKTLARSRRQRKNAATPSRKRAAPSATRKRWPLERPTPTSTAAAAKARIARARIMGGQTPRQGLASPEHRGTVPLTIDGLTRWL